MIIVTIPDPFRDIREPGLTATGLQMPDEVFVAEVVQPAEDLPLDSDEEPASLVPGGNRTEPIADPNEGRPQQFEPFLVPETPGLQRTGLPGPP